MFRGPYHLQVEKTVARRFSLQEAVEAIETSTACGKGIKVAVMP